MKTRSLCLVFVALLMAACSHEPTTPAPLDLHPGAFISAARCGDCHTGIYRVWSSSLHANSWTNATFRTSLKEVEGNRDVVQSCMNCHSPIATHSQSPPAQQIVNEGGDLRLVPLHQGRGHEPQTRAHFARNRCRKIWAGSKRSIRGSPNNLLSVTNGG